MDIIFEVRDGRIPMSTRHPHVPKWAGAKPRLLLLNRTDMVPDADRAAWSAFFASRGRKAQWTDGNQGDGVQKVGRRKDGEGGACAVGGEGGRFSQSRCGSAVCLMVLMWAAWPAWHHPHPRPPRAPPTRPPPNLPTHLRTHPRPHPNRRLSKQRWR